MRCDKCGFIAQTQLPASETACSFCNSYVEEQIIVSENQFSDTKSTHSSSTCSSFYSRFQNSKERNLNKAKKELENMAKGLNLNQYHVEAAFRLYSLALQKNQVCGKNINFTAAAALYAICRREKTSHLLIDFSDVLGQNLFKLGAIYRKFVKSMNLELPCIDPSLFIQRFCVKLQLQKKTNEISITALRFLQKMKRDWMVVGRRPLGLCGAAILLACRMHGLTLTSYDIAEQMPVSKETIQKRIREFKSSIQIYSTFQQSAQSQQRKECDPPSFTSKKCQAQPTLKQSKALILQNSMQEEVNETLSDIEDEEIDQYILNEEEQKIKSILWHKFNQE